MDVNVTLIETNDYFEKIYQSPGLNWGLTMLYLLGILCCAGLAMVSWFERSGQAGPYRTLVNQIATTNIDYLILVYATGFGINTFRGIIGPLPSVVCMIGDFFLVFCGITMSLSSLGSTATKFIFIYAYKSIPAVDDNFIALFLSLLIKITGFLCTLMKFSYDEKPMITHRICTGQWAFDDINKKAMPIAGIFIFGCFFINLGLSCAIWAAKKESKQVLVPHNQQNATFTSIGSISLTWLMLTLYSLTVGFFLGLQKMDLEELNSEKGINFVIMFNSVFPFLMTSVQFFFFFVTKKHVRKAVYDLMGLKNNSVHSVME